MFENIAQMIMDWFTAYAYEPLWVYAGMWTIMFLSCFGLPLPEEVVIISVGIVSYLARHPELYPPPYEGAVGVNVWAAACVGFLAVLLSDMLIYVLGKKYGRRFLSHPWIHRNCPHSLLARAEDWMKRYGFWASGLFRFTPGLRFPGHLACGMMGVPFHKFLLVDGGAALLAIPTQILLIGYYGHDVLEQIRAFKFWILVIAGGIMLLFLSRYLYRKHTSTYRA